MHQKVGIGCMVALLVVFGACGGGGSGGGSTATKRFHSPVYGYTLSHPTTWSAVPAAHRLDDGQPPATGGGGTDILGVNASTKVSQITLPALVIGGQKISPQVTADAWTSTVAGTVSFMKACPQPDAREPVTVGDTQGTLLRYDDCPKGSGLFHYWVAVVHRGVGYHIVWFDQQKQEATDRPAFDKVLKSFTFNG